jgi:hypothetical protein
VYRIFFRLLPLAVVLLAALPAFGQYTRDAAAVRKIDEAINQHYLSTDFNKAEAVLTGTVKACEDKCSPQTLGRAWMYVGIVRGSGKNDLAGAKDAFQTAITLDPEVKLDSALATPETQTAFNEVASGGGPAEAPAAPAEPAAPAGEPPAGAEGAPAGVNLTCTPEVTEIETRRAVPVQCTTDEELTNVELRFRAFGAETWKTLKMDKVGNGFRATIPCDATNMAGTLRLYVRGRDASGQDVANWGTKPAPVEFQIVESTQEEPPSFSDADPPARCAAKEICPPDFPGCDSGKASGGTVDWGGSCGNSSECKSGLLCIDGTCETAPSCSTDSDCPVGSCESGKCAVAGGGGDGPSGYKKWWIGLHVAQDVALVSGTDVCLDANQTADNWACYWASTQEDAPYHSEQFDTLSPGGGGTIAGGTAIATTRFLLSIDRAITDNITAGLRLGYAIGGGPPAGKQVTYDREGEGQNTYSTVINEGTAFLPAHAELRGVYWFGTTPLGKRGLRPYVHVGGGLAQVDARVVAKVRDDFIPGGAVPDEGTGEIDAWKKLGQGFATAGGGAAFALSPNLAFQLNLNVMMMIPASGFVFQPSLGLMYGAF